MPTWHKRKEEANQAAMLDSLTTINTQLGTLLDRLGGSQDTHGSVPLGTSYPGGRNTTVRERTYDEYPTAPRQSTR